MPKILKVNMDEERAKLYQNVKKHIDEYHKHYIDKKLAKIYNQDNEGGLSLWLDIILELTREQHLQQRS